MVLINHMLKSCIKYNDFGKEQPVACLPISLFLKMDLTVCYVPSVFPQTLQL